MTKIYELNENWCWRLLIQSGGAFDRENDKNFFIENFHGIFHHWGFLSKKSLFPLKKSSPDLSQNNLYNLLMNTQTCNLWKCFATVLVSHYPAEKPSESSYPYSSNFFMPQCVHRRIGLSFVQFGRTNWIQQQHQTKNG